MEEAQGMVLQFPRGIVGKHEVHGDGSKVRVHGDLYYSYLPCNASRIVTGWLDYQSTLLNNACLFRVYSEL